MYDTRMKPEQLHTKSQLTVGIASSYSGVHYGYMPLRTATRLIENAMQLRRINTPFELVIKMMEMLKKTLNLSKVTFFPIDYNVVKLTTENLSREGKA